MKADPVNRLPRREFGGDSDRLRRAAGDIVEGLRWWRLWTALGWQDVLQRYRRAMLGPLWITMSMATLVFALGFIYAGLFQIDTRAFLPYIAGGFVVWFYFASSINEATGTFISADNLIKDGGRPLSIYVFRLVHRNLIVAAHNVVVMLAIYVWQPALLNANILFLVPGLILFIANIIWMSLVVAILCTRFRDIPPIIANVVQMFFFISPIIYKPQTLPPELSFVVQYNPLAYFVEVLRAPLLGQVPPLSAYVAMTCFAVIGLGFSFWLFSRMRARIAYWL